MTAMSSDKRKGELRDGSRIEDGEVYSPSQSDSSIDDAMIERAAALSEEEQR